MRNHTNKPERTTTMVEAATVHVIVNCNQTFLELLLDIHVDQFTKQHRRVGSLAVAALVNGAMVASLHQHLPDPASKRSTKTSIEK